MTHSVSKPGDAAEKRLVTRTAQPPHTGVGDRPWSKFSMLPYSASPESYKSSRKYAHFLIMKL